MFKKTSLKYKFVFDKKTKKILIFLFSFIVISAFLYNFKHLFVSAVVNGRPITRLTLDKELEKQMGQQVLESLVTKSLIFQEAKKQKVKITSEQVDQEIESIKKEVESQGNDLETLLNLQGQSIEGLREQVEIQLIVEEIVGRNIEVSDQEVKEYFEENQENFFQDQELDEVKDVINQQLKQQKMTEKFQNWLEEIRKEAKILYFFKTK